MDDFDLRTLTDGAAGPDTEPRPFEAVLRRSHQIRRRRRVVKAAGLTAVAAGLFAAATFADRPEQVETVPATQPERDCIPRFVDEMSEWFLDQTRSAELSVRHVNDSLRFLPAFVPEELPIMRAFAGKAAPIDDCPLDQVLSLRADDDGTVESTIKVFGPIADETFDGFDYGEGDTSDVALRDTTATLFETTRNTDAGPVDLVALSWSDGGGSRWVIEAQGIDATTVHHLAEALVLDPAGDPVADLAADDVPEGFEIVWQARAGEPPTRAGNWWTVLLGEDLADACAIDFTNREEPGPIEAHATPGDQLTSVRGQTALVRPTGVLRWEEPGVAVMFECPGVDIEVLKQIAESLELVRSDDPRLPPD